MSQMSESKFHDQVDDTLEALEDLLDNSGLDLDLVNSGGVLTVQLEGGSQLIFSRQPPLRQLWVATRSGGYHFDWDAEQGLWICDSDGLRLGERLTLAVKAQAGEDVDFSDF